MSEETQIDETPRVEVEPLEMPDILVVESRDPSKYYRLVKKDDASVSRREAQGYKVVNSSDKAGANLKEIGSSRCVGDLILMEMPRTLQERRRKAIDAKGRAWKGAVKEEFHALCDTLGMKTYEEDPTDRKRRK